MFYRFTLCTSCVLLAFIKRILYCIARSALAACTASHHLQALLSYATCVHNNRAPSYLVDSVTATASLSHRGRLRYASSQRYEQPRTRLKFDAFAGPAAWNSLPSSFQELTDTTAFKHQLKTVMFQRCYSSST